ncbi:MAG: RNA polymerase sigma factor [Planctomycetota bacterium]|nr:RNA polymerase sigma factor [Planctomycetota bacterium]
MTHPKKAEGFQELVRRAQGGSREAMDGVLEMLRAYLEPLARSFADPTRPAESTSDLLQECCLRAWRKLDSFQGGENDDETFAMFRAWMGQILRRLGLNAKRDRLAKSKIPPNKLQRLRSRAGTSTGLGGAHDLPAPNPTPTANARAAEMVEQVKSALERLPDQTAARIIRMRLFDGMTIVQIAKRLGLTSERAQERHRWAMRRLRRQLGEWLEDWT